jgi:hypothetical protein
MVFGLTWPQLEPTIYPNRGKYVNDYTIDAVSIDENEQSWINVYRSALFLR